MGKRDFTEVFTAGARRVGSLRNEHCFSPDGAVWWQGHHPDRRCVSRLFFSSQRDQKSAKGIYLTDLAEYLDARIEAARKEMTALTT
jgi:hypothetical protein